MTIASEITRIRAAKAALMTAINSKGGTLTATQLLGDYAPAVDAIQTGGGETSFYQCASVDTAAGTWTGYKWEWDSTKEVYVLSSNLTSDELTIKGYIPKVELTYSADTYIKAGSVWIGSSLPVSGQLWGYKNGEILFDNTITATATGTPINTDTGIATFNNGNYFTLDETVCTGASPRTFIFHAELVSGRFVQFVDGGTARTKQLFGIGWGRNGDYMSHRFWSDDNFNWVSLPAGSYIISVVYDGASLTCYVNGAQAGTYTTTLDTGSTYRYYIGRYAVDAFGGDGEWTSKFYAIYDRALTQDEIAQLTDVINNA